MSIHDPVSRSATAQRLETAESIDARFGAWDCEQGSVRPWGLGQRQRVLSLVRLLADEAEELAFSTPMEVTIAPTTSYQPSLSWRDRFGGTYQVAVYPNANPDWGSIEAEVSTLEEALEVADTVCSDLEEKYDLLTDDERENGEVALSSRGPKPIV
ncbi:hypothetical protein [Natrialba sp. INN-245]|uniref:hypothetical protein n=1 Tax=Natrialba sp. INN-245 TaxID=2690967 RepID=UPI00130FB31D|nr:hypothetical protein [Natrialba sp. INN-245]MWV39610.1 hypothetical protein [Natrialba sp. INN-245]